MPVNFSRQRGRSTAADARAVARSEARSMHLMSNQLNILNSRLSRRLAEARLEASEQSALVNRAERLNARLDVLKHKLRMCFDLSGEAPPDSLQTVLQHMQSFAEPEDAPPEFVCPITQCVMVDPVATEDKKVYDRSAIIEWFANFPSGKEPTSPLTNLPLSSTTLVPQVALRQRIQEFLKAAKDEQVQNGTVKVEEPSVRMLPPQASDPGAQSLSITASILENLPDVTTDSPEADRDRGPIWSSSVVPHSEPNSRALNMLRVADDMVPEDVLEESTQSASHSFRGLVSGTTLPRSDQRTTAPPEPVNRAVRRTMSVEKRLLEAQRPRNALMPASSLYELPGSPLTAHRRAGPSRGTPSSSVAETPSRRGGPPTSVRAPPASSGPSLRRSNSTAARNVPTLSGTAIQSRRDVSSAGASSPGTTGVSPSKPRKPNVSLNRRQRM